MARARIWRIATQILVPVLLIGGTWWYLHLRSYSRRDPRFCGNCHELGVEFRLWTESEHKNLACQECHHTSDQAALDALTKFWRKGSAIVPKHAQVNVDACVRCHVSHDSQWLQVGASAGHRTHYEAQKIPCVRCHSPSMHKFTPAREICRECHQKQVVMARGMEKLHCLTSHDFLSTTRRLTPGRRDCLRCHRQQGLPEHRFVDDGPMQLPCTSCHHPHREQHASVKACDSCHQEMHGVGLHRRRGHQECTACHQPHTWRSTPAACAGCHKKPGHHKGEACCGCHSFRRQDAATQPASAPAR
jgi:hypothetical protein